MEAVWTYWLPFGTSMFRLSPLYMNQAWVNCLKLFRHCEACVCCLALDSAGNNNAVKLATMAITTIISTNVKANFGWQRSWRFTREDCRTQIPVVNRNAVKRKPKIDLARENAVLNNPQPKNPQTPNHKRFTYRLRQNSAQCIPRMRPD